VYNLSVARFARLSGAVCALWVALPPCVSATSPLAEQALAAYRADATYANLTILYPDNDTIYPPDIAPCSFAWREDITPADTWLIVFSFADGAAPLNFASERNQWKPSPADWEVIKQHSKGKKAIATVIGFQGTTPSRILSKGQVSFSTSPDEVGAPLFYREVNLPFINAVGDPSRIRWRFGSISSPEPPPVVLEHLPVCGNCHSFSSDGQTLGMDVDYANNKGSYVITRVAKEMSLATSDIITWDNYRKEDGQMTFGLLSQVSPDGQVVVSTVKDKSVFLARPDLAFSQLFFPVRGILVVYHRNGGMFQPLPGADDPEYVQSNPAWSPDGKELLFARAQAYQLKNLSAQGKLLLNEEDCQEFARDGKPFKYDLYRIAYNDGKGGKAEPVQGASRNGRSNYFPKYSPDGKWIVFCQANNYMLLQPDSQLFIIPAAGGEARRLRCNTPRMNSWHSWSPNSRWLVFSSKRNSPYTQLFLTHIDEHGDSSPPVVLENFTAPDRAANIPEFVNAPATAIARIKEQFLDDYSHVRSAFMAEFCGDTDTAIADYRKALELNPNSVHAHQRLGYLLYNVKQQYKEGESHTLEALRLYPNSGLAHYDMGMILRHQKNLEEAARHFAKAVQLTPPSFSMFGYSAAEMNATLGEVWLSMGRVPDAAAVLATAVNLDPKNAKAQYYLALCMAAQGQFEEALRHYPVACSLDPSVDTVPELHMLLSGYYVKAGRTDQALASARKALTLAQNRGDLNLADTISKQVAGLEAQGAGK